MQGHGGKQNQVCDLKGEYERKALYQARTEVLPQGLNLLLLSEELTQENTSEH